MLLGLVLQAVPLLGVIAAEGVQLSRDVVAGAAIAALLTGLAIWPAFGVGVGRWLRRQGRPGHELLPGALLWFLTGVLLQLLLLFLGLVAADALCVRQPAADELMLPSLLERCSAGDLLAWFASGVVLLSLWGIPTAFLGARLAARPRTTPFA